MSRPTTHLRLAVGRLRLYRNREPAVELIEDGTNSPLPETMIPLVVPAPKSVAEGDYLVVKVERLAGDVLQARYERRLGPLQTPSIDVEIVSILYGLTRGWSSAAQDEARHQASTIARKAGGQRRDLLKMPLVTIDDETAKDHDDAVYCETQPGGGWRLWVAIADVSAYVTPGSMLDVMALERATSIYLPQDVIPMLPEALSNNICSLKPDSERLCLVCEISFSSTGAVNDYSFYEGLMRSSARLTYNQVEAVLSGSARPSTPVAQHVAALRTLGALYTQLKNRRIERGALDIESSQAVFIFDKRRHLKDVVFPPRNDAHKVIEECMISANVCAADFCAKLPFSTPYRVHEPPAEPDHLELVHFARRHNLKLDGRIGPTSKAYQYLAKQISQNDHSNILSLQILRAMSKAQYKTRNIGHFGLSLDAYTHFTSPIRRYADLLVHRSIKAGLALKKSGQHDFDYSEDVLDTMLDEINQRTQQAERASRFAEGWHKCALMQGRVGESFTGRISGVATFGLFVQLDAPAVDGLVHVSDLGRDYFEFDARRQQLIGTRTRTKFSVGDAMQITLTKVDQHRGRLAFTPNQRDPKRRPPPRKRHR